MVCCISRRIAATLFLPFEFLTFSNSCIIPSTESLLIFGFFDFLFKDYSIKSKNVLSDNLIKIEQIDGPFKYFTGEWRVTNKNDLKTLIEFNAEFELPFFLNNLLPEKIIDKFCESMIDAFIEWLSKK